MTTTHISNADLNDIISAADEVITAIAGENDEVHPDNSTKMCALWDDLNDLHAPPEVVKSMARELLAARQTIAAMSEQQPVKISQSIRPDIAAERFLPECLKADEISGDARPARISELMGWFSRYYDGNANPKWLRELCYYILTAPQPAVVPDGYVLVPIEPTEDMVIAGFESEPDESFSESEGWEAYESMSGCQQAAHKAKLCWAVMLAATPSILPACNRDELTEDNFKKK